MKSDIVKEIIKRLKKAYPQAGIALNYSNPLELLVATILSAQCTDKRVNMVTGSLFKKYRSLSDYASADVKEFESDIHSVGFYRNKAKNIIASAIMIKDNFGGKVPSSMDEMLALPGVARKTANIVLGNAYGIVEGIAVDTHVIRLSNRLGMSENADPKKIEQDLMKIVSKNDWFKISYLLQQHGRAVCVARKPKHEICVLRNICISSKI
jgi:endonuclease-3